MAKEEEDSHPCSGELSPGVVACNPLAQCARGSQEAATRVASKNAKRTTRKSESRWRDELRVALRAVNVIYRSGLVFIKELGFSPNVDLALAASILTKELEGPAVELTR